MKKQLRSALSTEGRRMAGARALWVANGMKREQMGKPIVAIANSLRGTTGEKRNRKAGLLRR